MKRQMDKLGTKVEPIPFVYNKKGFSCIFDIGVEPYRLIMTTLGLHPQAFRFDVASGYLLVPQLSQEEMKELIRYLQLKPDPNHNFTIEDMMLLFNRRAKDHVVKVETASGSSNNKKSDDGPKPYFFKWQHNKENHVTEENLEKTERYMGMEMKKYCVKNNVSSCWRSVPKVSN